jgi:hypothetical protein
MTMTHKLPAVLLALAMATTAVAQTAATAKTASDYFLQYHKSMATAKSIEDLRPFMDADQQKEMDKAPKAEQEMGVKMISGMYADFNDIKVVKETAKGSVYTLDVTATHGSEKTAGTGTVEVSKDAAGWHVDSEVWQFAGSTLTLKKKKP